MILHVEDILLSYLLSYI